MSWSGIPYAIETILGERKKRDEIRDKAMKKLRASPTGDRTMSDEAQIERLRQLVTEANLPWRTDLIDVVRDDPNDDDPWTVAHCGAGEETADLIVEVVNATPRLLDTIVAQANEIEWLNTLIGDKAAKQIEADGNRIEALSAENERLRDLLSRNIDDEPCYYDHHGYCQAHYIEEDCSVAAARVALGDTK